MASGLIAKIREFVEGNPSVKKVADDIELTSELILLMRMMFADGEMKAEELENFKRMCTTAFGIAPQDVQQVIEYLKDFGYETTAAKAASVFTELAPERKRSLLVHMLAIAKSDNELHPDETELIRRTAALLGLTSEDIRAARAGG